MKYFKNTRTLYRLARSNRPSPEAEPRRRSERAGSKEWGCLAAIAAALVLVVPVACEGIEAVSDGLSISQGDTPPANPITGDIAPTTTQAQAEAPQVEATLPSLNCSRTSEASRPASDSELALARLGMTISGETEVIEFACPDERSFSKVADFSGQIAGISECAVVALEQIGAGFNATAVCQKLAA